MENIIGKRIGSLIKETSVKQKDLAKYIEVTDNTISYFVRGTRKPNLQQIISISEFFGVSVDYLLGKTDTKTSDPTLREVCQYLGLKEETVCLLHHQNEIDNAKNWDSFKFVKLTESMINHHFYNTFLNALSCYFETKFAAEEDNIDPKEERSLYSYITEQDTIFSEHLRNEIEQTTKHKNNLIIPSSLAEDLLKRKIEEIFSDMTEHLYYEWKRDIKSIKNKN